jgi:hypothetical protein
MHRTVILFVLAFATAARAHAQPAPWEPERLSAGWVFTPSAVVGTLWDSNVTMQNERADIVSEWVTLLNPRGELDFNGRRTHFNLGYSGAFEAYRQFNELNRYEQRARHELRYQVSPRLALYSRGGLSMTPTTDRLELGAGALPFLDVGSRVFDTSGGFRVEVTPHTRIEGVYGFQHMRFEQDDPPIFELRGGYAHMPSGRLTHDVTSRLSLGGSWEYKRANIEGGAQTFDIHEVGGDLSYRVSAATTVGLSAGMAHMRVSDPDLSTWGPAFRGSIQHQAGSVTFGARYERTFIPSFSFGGVTSNQTLMTDVRIGFAGGRGYVSGGLSYARTDPIEALGLGYRLDSTWVNGAIGYHVARWLRAEGFYGGSQQLTTVRGNFDRSRIGVQFVTFKPVRIQ